MTGKLYVESVFASSLKTHAQKQKYLENKSPQSSIIDGFRAKELCASSSLDLWTTQTETEKIYFFSAGVIGSCTSFPSLTTVIVVASPGFTT
jgi:hypothetical protein